MIELDEYRLDKCVQQTPESELLLATRERDGVEVLIKRLYSGGTQSQRQQLSSEYEALTQAAGPGLVRALGLNLSAQQPHLVLECAGGHALAEALLDGPLGIEESLEVALQIAGALERLHEAHFMHCALTPEGIAIEPGSLRTTMVDLGQARRFGASTSRESGAEWQGDLRYAAPEQHGRMNRGIDFRSDLYALGAVLYHILTGQPPFPGDDALALIHAHMARIPVPPIERRDAIPATLSRIAMKLLHKEPDDRYQTARAVRLDLEESRRQLRQTGQITDDLRLGTADAPFKPLFPSRLFGREPEVSVLLEAYAAAASGRAELLLLRGPPGMGKSVLASELREALVRSRGYLAQGKFDHYRNLPFSGFRIALASLVDQILVESEASLQSWKAQITGELGNLAGALCELVPDLTLITGEPPVLPALGPAETQARLALAVERLIRATARPEHPLVLFLDDLQWSDAGSRDLLESLLRSTDGSALLVIGAYRDNEVHPDHPFAQLVARLERADLPRREIELAPLTRPAIAAMLSDALLRPESDVQTLARHVELKTSGIPLMIQQFIHHMHELGEIHYVAPHGWTWDDDRIATADVPEGAVGLMVARLKRLGARERTVIELASCVGDEFERSSVATLMGEPVSALEPSLFKLAEQGLLAPSSSGFRFVHDRVREGAQSLLSEQERATLHRRAGLDLHERSAPEQLADRSFEIADHLNRARAVLNRAEHSLAREMNQMAGQHALASGAAAGASAYFESGLALVTEETWESEPDRTAALYLGGATAARQAGRFPRALELLDALDAQSIPQMVQVWSWAERLSALASLSEAAPENSENAADRTHAALRQLGIRWPRNPSKLRVALEILRTDWMLRGPLGEALFPPAKSDDISWMAPLMVLASGGSALLQDSPGLAFVSTRFSIALLLEHGAPQGMACPGYALATYAAFRAIATLQPRASQRVAEAAEAWMERVPHPANERGRLCLRSNVDAWLQPRSAVVESLRRVAESLGELGDLEFKVYALRAASDYALISGQPLPDCRRHLESLARRCALQSGAYYAQSMIRLVGLLQNPQGPPFGWREEFDAARELLEGSRDIGVHLFWSLWVSALCFMGEYRFAAELAAQIEEDLFLRGAPGSTVADFSTMRGVASFVSAAQSEGRERRRHLRTGRRCARRVQKWSSYGPDFPHMSHWLQAEYARAQGDPRRALSLYADAARRARQQGYRHLAALIRERRAELLVAQGRIRESRADLTEALALYAEWGALAKVTQLESQLG